MPKGKLIVIEGTDCSGKETQSKRLIERLNQEGMPTTYRSFPMYETPTGKIVGYPYLGKSYIASDMVHECAKKVHDIISQKYPHLKESEVIDLVLDALANELGTGWFKETAPMVDPKVSCLYYAADRRYNLNKINATLDEGVNIILDRYTYSSMAHQGGKIRDAKKRQEMYEWIANLEFASLGLPASDIRLFLHMPTDYATFLREGRTEKLDENERDKTHLYHAEEAYLEVSRLYDFETIQCIRDKEESIPTFANIKTPEEIGEEVYSLVKKRLQK